MRTTRTIPLAALLAAVRPADAKGLDAGVLSPGQRSVVETPPLRAGAVYTIQVTGDTDGDLDCGVVAPDQETLLAKDGADVDACLLSFRAPADGAHLLLIVNSGREATAYVASISEVVGS